MKPLCQYEGRRGDYDLRSELQNGSY